jgi:peroxiredoxin
MRRVLPLSILRLLVVVLSGAMLLPATAVPVVISSTSNEAQAMEMLDRAANAYAALEGLSMRVAYYHDGDGEVLRGYATIAYEKSGRTRIKHSVIPTPMIYAVASSDPKVAKAALGRNIQFMGGPAALPLTTLVQGRNPLRQASVTVMDEKFVWGNKPHLLPDNGVAVMVTPPADLDYPPLELAMYFDPNDHLLRRVDVKGQDEGEKFFQSTILSDVQINPQFAADMFVEPKLVEPKRIKWDPKIVEGSEPYPLRGVELSQYRGKVILLDFWATWCGPCVKEVPGLLRSYQQHHGEGFEIIGISQDKDKKALADFVKARKMSWPQVFDPAYGKLSNRVRYGVKAIPVTFLIGKDGRIAAVNPRGKELEPAVKKALEQ